MRETILQTIKLRQLAAAAGFRKKHSACRKCVALSCDAAPNIDVSGQVLAARRCRRALAAERCARRQVHPGTRFSARVAAFPLLSFVLVLSFAFCVTRNSAAACVTFLSRAYGLKLHHQKELLSDRILWTGNVWVAALECVEAAVFGLTMVADGAIF